MTGLQTSYRLPDLFHKRLADAARHRLAFRFPLLLRDMAFAHRHILIIGARRGLDRLGHDGRAVDDRRDDDAGRVLAITIAAMAVGGRIAAGVGAALIIADLLAGAAARPPLLAFLRSEEHTSELQSLMRISYAVF